jgi:hypothetical protein
MERAVVNKNSSSSVSLNKKIYGKNTYKNVIDTEFKELVPPTLESENAITVDQLFQAYNELFFQIPKTGNTNSHEYLIKQSSEYIGFEQNSDDIEALLQEINQLRKDLLDANQKIVDLTSKT